MFQHRATRFALLAIVFLIATSSFAAVPISDEARQHFDVGVRLLRDPEGPRHEEAYRAFKKAYAASPSPKILGNIGLCAMKLERDSEAIESYQRYLAEVSKFSPGEREQIESDLEVLEASVVPLTLTIAPAGAIVVDERVPVRGDRIVNRYGPVEGTLSIGVRAGNHHITVELEGYEPAEWKFEATPGEPQQHSITLAGLSDLPIGPSGSDADGAGPVGAYVALGLTGAVAVGSVVTGVLALGKGSDYDDVKATDRVAAEEIRDEGETLNIVTDVLIGTAAAGGIVTIILFATHSDEAEGASSEEDSPTAGLRLIPSAGPDGAGLFVVGQF